MWEQSPDTTLRNWTTAIGHCANRTVGSRKGWVLPMKNQLASLFDPNNPDGNPDLPLGHPFLTVQSSSYWSATTDANNPSSARIVGIDGGLVFAGSKTQTFFFWCVRGGQSFDGNTHTTLH